MTDSTVLSDTKASTPISRVSKEQTPSVMVSIYELVALLLGCRESIEKYVIGPLTQAGYDLKERMAKLGELRKDITELRQGIKTNGGKVDRTISANEKKLQSIVERMQESIDKTIEMPTVDVTDQFLMGWDNMCGTESTSQNAETSQLTTQVTQAKQTESVYPETASSLVKINTNTGQSIAQAVR